MKKLSKRFGVGFLSLIFLLALVSASPAEAKTPLRWESVSHYTFEPEWTGDIWRDDGSHGTLILDIVEWSDLTNVQHSSGIWSITWDDGGYLEGNHEGKVVWSTGEFVLNGEVTDTSSLWDHLNGRHIHIMGSIDATWTSYATFQIN